MHYHSPDKTYKLTTLNWDIQVWEIGSGVVLTKAYPDSDKLADLYEIGTGDGFSEVITQDVFQMIMKAVGKTNVEG